MSWIKKLKDSKTNRIQFIRITVILISVTVLLCISLKVIASENEATRTDIVDFDNSSLSYAIKITLNDMYTTESEAAQVTKLDLSKTPFTLKNWKELKSFRNLKSITIEDSTIQSFKGIEKLEHLESITIRSSRIEDMSRLRDLNLSNITIIRCGISGSINLGNMPMLKNLNLSGNYLQSVKGNCPELNTCNLSNNYIESVKGNYPTLITFNLSNNEIETLKSVDISQSVKELLLNGNPIESINGLEEFDNINKLGITNTDVKDLSAIKGMEGLNALYIDEDDMSSELDYLYDNFRNGDNIRKKEYLSQLYNIER